MQVKTRTIIGTIKNRHILAEKAKTTCNSVEFRTVYCSGCHVNDPCVQLRSAQDGLSILSVYRPTHLSNICNSCENEEVNVTIHNRYSLDVLMTILMNLVNKLFSLGDLAIGNAAPVGSMKTYGWYIIQNTTWILILTIIPSFYTYSKISNFCKTSLRCSFCIVGRSEWC